MSTTKQRNVPPGKPPEGYRWLKRGETILPGDRSVWGTPHNCSLCTMAARIGEYAGLDPEDMGSVHGGDKLGLVRPLPAKPKRAKKRKSVEQLCLSAAKREHVFNSRDADYFRYGFRAGFRAAQRRAKGGAK